MTITKLAAPNACVALSALFWLAGCAGVAAPDADKAAYQGARRALEESRNDDAATQYAALLHAGGAYGEAGLLDSGYAALRRGEPLGAQAIARRYIERYPQSERLPYAIVLEATAHYALLRDAPAVTNAEIDAAIAHLKHIGEAYPAVAPPDVVTEMIADLKARRQ